MENIAEIVHVLDHSRLIDSESYEHCYWTAKSRAFGPGFYVVRWPTRSLRRRYDQSASFTGPFDTHSEAQASVDRSMDPSLQLAPAPPWHPSHATYQSPTKVPQQPDDASQLAHRAVDEDKLANG